MSSQVDNRITLIEFIGGPGVGKTTISAGLWHHLKNNHYYAEFVREIAQNEIFKRGDLDLVSNLFLISQLYQKIKECSYHNPKYIITDMPILGPIIYPRSSQNDTPELIECYELINKHIRKEFNVITFYVMRHDDSKYYPNGRLQNNIEDAMFYDENTIRVYNKYKVKMNSIYSNLSPKFLFENFIKVN